MQGCDWVEMTAPEDLAVVKDKEARRLMQRLNSCLDMLGKPWVLSDLEGLLSEDHEPGIGIPQPRTYATATQQA
jgi:hypothetical protein